MSQVEHADPTPSEIVNRHAHVGCKFQFETARKPLHLHRAAFYVTGFTRSSNFPVVGGVQSVYGGPSSDAFITKLKGSLVAVDPAAPTEPSFTASPNPTSGSVTLSGRGEHVVRRTAVDGRREPR